MSSDVQDRKIAASNFSREENNDGRGNKHGKENARGYTIPNAIHG
jgi:hypothetical protein